jgi:hypothetical protein
MPTHFKAAATLAFGVATLLGAGPANAACDGTVMRTYTGRTTQCYYLPTVNDGRVTGLQLQVNHGGAYPNHYGYGGYGHGATIGAGGWGHHGR